MFLDFEVSLDFGLAQVQHLLAKKDRVAGAGRLSALRTSPVGRIDQGAVGVLLLRLSLSPASSALSVNRRCGSARLSDLTLEPCRRGAPPVGAL